jgi:hypothetical protein
MALLTTGTNAVATALANFASTNTALITAKTAAASTLAPGGIAASAAATMVASASAALQTAASNLSSLMKSSGAYAAQLDKTYFNTTGRELSRDISSFFADASASVFTPPNSDGTTPPGIEDTNTMLGRCQLISDDIEKSLIVLRSPPTPVAPSSCDLATGLQVPCTAVSIIKSKDEFEQLQTEIESLTCQLRGKELEKSRIRDAFRSCAVQLEEIDTTCKTLTPGIEVPCGGPCGGCTKTRCPHPKRKTDLRPTKTRSKNKNTHVERRKRVPIKKKITRKKKKVKLSDTHTDESQLQQPPILFSSRKQQQNEQPIMFSDDYGGQEDNFYEPQNPNRYYNDYYL